jgi:tRNA-Thr(GGU) m(6)t(6)A37 methyltransferase TsaA
MNSQPDDFSFSSIGVIRSPFSEKFGIPRQPRLTPSITTTIVLHKQFSDFDIVDQLSSTSHIWILFVFSECYQSGWKPKVRPPRLGGNQKIGVFASRSPFRPNPIGISAVELVSIEKTDQNISICIKGADLLNGTPILDIKPYIPYSDKIDEASNQLAESFIPLSQPIYFSSAAQKQCENHLLQTQQSLSEMIEQVLRCDPRPAYQHSLSKEYGIKLYDYNIRWQITPERIDIISICKEIET